MTIPFYNYEIIRAENIHENAYIGYLSENGQLIGFNNSTYLSKAGHDEWLNPIALYFLKFISYTIGHEIVIRGFNDCNISLFSQTMFIDELNKNIDSFKVDKSSNKMNEESLFIYNLLLFFQKAYSNVSFFNAIDMKINVMSKDDFCKKYFGNDEENLNDDWEEDFLERFEYGNYLKQQLMQYFKDIVVMYIGYDSIERFDTFNNIIDYEKDLFVNNEITPRIITTSYFNINERFYNYLLMDWVIHQIPKYYWNETNRKYERKTEYFNSYQSQKEEILEKEIQSIKRLVPLKDRYKYFR